MTTAATTVRKSGSEIGVGDFMLVAGRSHRIVSVRPYVGTLADLFGGDARMAFGEEAGWCITLISSQHYTCAA